MLKDIKKQTDILVEVLQDFGVESGVRPKTTPKKPPKKVAPKKERKNSEGKETKEVQEEGKADLIIFLGQQSPPTEEKASPILFFVGIPYDFL